MVSRNVSPSTLLIDFLPINFNSHSRHPTLPRQPSLRRLVVERPRWNNHQERQSRARESNPERVVDILLYVTHDEGQKLKMKYVSIDLRGRRTCNVVRTYSRNGKDKGGDEFGLLLALKVLCLRLA